MNGIAQNGKKPNFEEVYPGCLGRMVNLFELNIGASPNRLLADKPHQDGSPVSRSRSDVSRMIPSLGQVEEKVIESGSRNSSSHRKSNGTPIKMLIAQEMSKEVDPRRSPNVVAKLMGLDALPQQESEQPATKRSHFKGQHHRSHSEIPMSNWDQQDRLVQYADPNSHIDVYEIWEQPQKLTHNDKRMALVRQKFVEAKRLSTDGRLSQSKQFQDALEVLSSNKDLFLKCLQEPNSMFSQQLCKLQSITRPADTKRITVLRPSEMVGNYNIPGDREGKKQMKKCSSEESHLKSFSPENYKNRDSPTQPTRIVVLKSSLEKILDDKAGTSPQFQSSRIIHGEDFFGDVEDNENRESREVAKAITNRMREKLGWPHRDDDDTMIYSVLPNGYVADESSFNKSDIEYPSGNLSDSEAMSLVSRHSWDYVNRLGSPFSSSSFSRASYSPESSVSREAKKRLSERWALMESNGTSQEQRHVRRSSSTLGEMLALSEAKKEIPTSTKKRISKEESKDSISEQRVDNEDMDSSSGHLTRSKSVPVSSSQFVTRLDAEINSVLVEGKLGVPKEDAKSKNAKFSFKGKVSSLFFARNKKASKDKSMGSETKNEISSDETDNIVEKFPDRLPSGMLELPSDASSSCVTLKQSVVSPEAQFSSSKFVASGTPGENQDQPSPVSVLDSPFELNEYTVKVYPRVQRNQCGYELSQNPFGSNLIDKSPPIGSIARTLSWDDSHTDTASSYPIKKEQSIAHDANEEEEQEWYIFAKTLLSLAGLQGKEVQSSLSLAKWHSPESPLDPSLRDKYISLSLSLAKWHSPESPLDPSLRDKYISLSGMKTPHEAKRRQKRSMQKLVFDCVNAALVELEEYGQGSVLDEVWARMYAWFSGECVSAGDFGEENVLVVRTEVAGKGWAANMSLERGILGKEFEGDLLEELLEEAVVELAGRWRWTLI